MMYKKQYFPFLLLLFISLNGWAYGQSENLYDFSLMRQNDNIDTLLFKNQKDKNLYEKSKMIRLSENSSISFGGSWRLQFESFKNQGFEQQDNGNRIWILNRFLGHSHVKLKKGEIFGEFISSFTDGKADLSPVDAEKLAVNQLFIKYNLTPEFKAGIGRENLKLGSGRVIDPREGPGVRRAFDMIQFQYKKNIFTALLFFGATGNANPRAFDNNYLDFNETLTTFYTTTRINSKNSIDAYLMYQKDNDVTYSNVSGNERRAMVGLRHFGSFESFNFNNEYFYQFGRVSNQTVQAWAVAFQLEKQIDIGGYLSIVGFKSNIISGDVNANDHVTNTFDPFYPRGAYFGRVASFAPSNFFDLHPYINVSVNRFSFELDYDVFWRYSLQDGLYNPSVRLEFEDLNDERFIAHQIGFVSGYKPNNFLSVELESNLICPGAFLKESGKNKTLLHVVFTAEFTF